MNLSPQPPTCQALDASQNGAHRGEAAGTVPMDGVTMASIRQTAGPQLASYPVDVFPPSLRNYCGAVASAQAIPEDYVALPLLVAAAAAIGNSRAVFLQDKNWEEGPRLYAMMVGDSSSGKSPALQAVLQPLRDLQLQLLQDYQSASARTEERGGGPERLIVSDITVEALAPILQRSRGLVLAADEGAALPRAMNQYKGGRGTDRQFWLAAWSGTCHIVDRKNQGAMPTTIARPFIGIIGGLTPDQLGTLANADNRHDGFVPRFLFAFPPATSAPKWTAATLSESTRQQWRDTLLRLRQLDVVTGDDGVTGPRQVCLTSAGMDRLVTWWDAHADEMNRPDLALSLRAPWGKFRTYILRLALVLHYLWWAQTEGPEGQIDADSVDRAAQLIHYFKSHACRVHQYLQRTPEDGQLDEILAWVQSHGGRCTARDLVRAKKATPTTRAKKLLVELTERGHGRIERHGAGNNKIVEWFIAADNP
ncbi:MAG: DUF3987 domain-containing protein [Planctomycetia bacterium]|nr:DUF3987 domain-containing protein [Planctomycetia bacterium]